MFVPTLKRACLAALILFAPLSHAKENTATNTPAAKQLHALLADHWEWTRREFPESSTAQGDHRYNDRLTDLSPEAVAKRKQKQAEFYARLQKIDASKLGKQDRISYAVFERQRKSEQRVNAIYGNLPFSASDNWLPLSTMSGLHTSLPTWPRSAPFNTVADYENYVKRLQALPRMIDQIIARLEAGMQSGWMPGAVAIARIPSQLDAHTVTDMNKNLTYVPFLKFAPAIPAPEQTRLAEAGRKALLEGVIPAFQKLKAFYQTQYIPKARKDIAASTLPGGMAYYNAMVADMTTTEMTAQQVHETGLAEVKRIDAEMEKAVQASGFKGTRAEFINFINTDPQFLFTSPEAILQHYRDIAKRADAAIPPLFAEVPRLQYGIRAMEPWEGDNAEHYTRGNADGSRAAYFEANVLNLKRRSLPSMEALVLHEAMPGHHMQIARAQELSFLPNFRRFSGFTAYSEGWGLYAESLGTQMGFYTTPYTKFGQLSLEMHRAVRLVVDTGMHAMGWDRERSIAYLESNAALTRAFATAEIDRYINWPGQALGYKIGELRIKAMRAKAEAALGGKFDIRRFHNALLDNGPLPMDVLEQQIDLWVAEQKAKK